MGVAFFLANKKCSAFIALHLIFIVSLTFMFWLSMIIFNTLMRHGSCIKTIDCSLFLTKLLKSFLDVSLYVILLKFISHLAFHLYFLLVYSFLFSLLFTQLCFVVVNKIDERKFSLIKMECLRQQGRHLPKQ